jgi:hypothetical protein
VGDGGVSGERCTQRSRSRTGFPFALYFVLFSVVAENDVVTSARDAALLSAICAVLVLAALASLAVYRESERRLLSHLAYRGQPVTYDRFTERFGVPNAVVEMTIFAVAGVVLFLGYIGLFGQYFYPTMLKQLGGGRPRIAQILVSGDAVPAVRELGLDVTEDAPLSPPVELLWEGQESYVIRLPRPHLGAVVQIGGGLVGGVVTGEVLVLPEGDDSP